MFKNPNVQGGWWMTRSIMYTTERAHVGYHQVMFNWTWIWIYAPQTCSMKPEAKGGNMTKDHSIPSSRNVHRSHLHPDTLTLPYVTWCSPMCQWSVQPCFQCNRNIIGQWFSSFSCRKMEIESPAYRHPDIIWTQRQLSRGDVPNHNNKSPVKYNHKLFKLFYSSTELSWG